LWWCVVCFRWLAFFVPCADHCQGSPLRKNLIWFNLISSDFIWSHVRIIWSSDFSDEIIIFSSELRFFSYSLRCSSDFLYDCSFSCWFSLNGIWSQMIRWISHTTCMLICSLTYFLGILMTLSCVIFRCWVGKSCRLSYWMK